MNKRLYLLSIIIILFFSASALAMQIFVNNDENHSLNKAINSAKKINDQKLQSWNKANVKNSIYKLSNVIGVREAGSNNEHRAANYIEKRLRDVGYTVARQFFKISNGKTSYNVVAQKSGSSSKKIIIGAHYDTKSPSPGANDNGSGVASLLELARIFKDTNPRYTTVFVFFGSEEKVGSNSNNHHFGSRYYVKKMSASAKRETAGMISVDMVGYGSRFHVRSMKKGTMNLVNSLLGFGKKNGFSISYLKDPGKTGWSDHEAFELAGIPSAWLEWRDDPTYHSAKDNFKHIQWGKIDLTGDYLFKFLKE